MDDVSEPVNPGGPEQGTAGPRASGAPAEVVLTVGPTTVTEGSGPSVLTVTASWKGDGLRQAVTLISVAVRNGTATSADDSTTPVTLTIPAGARGGTAILVLTPVHDDLAEADEAVNLVGSAPTTAELGGTALAEPPR